MKLNKACFYTTMAERLKKCGFSGSEWGIFIQGKVVVVVLVVVFGTPKKKKIMSKTLITLITGDSVF